MKLLDLTRFMEAFASTGELGQIDFVFSPNVVIRHDAMKSNKDRLLVISVGSLGDMETSASFIYEREILNSECKVKDLSVLSQNEFMFKSYAYTTKAYVELISQILIEKLCDKEVVKLYYEEDPNTINRLDTGDIQFIEPMVVENEKHTNPNLEQRVFGTAYATSSTQEAFETIVDHMKDHSISVQEIELTVKTELAIKGQYYWQKLMISKVNVFDELHWAFARLQCAQPDKYTSSYIAKITDTDAVNVYLVNVFGDMQNVLTKVSSNTNTFTTDIKYLKK